MRFDSRMSRQGIQIGGVACTSTAVLVRAPASIISYRYWDLPVIMIDALYCRSTAVLLAMHVWLCVVAVLYCTWSQMQVGRLGVLLLL